MERKHAVLSASGAHRWLNCPPSAKLEEKMEDKSSVYAQEGTLAHELAELELSNEFEFIKERDYKKKLQQLQEHDLYSPEMPDQVQKYVEYVAEQYAETGNLTNSSPCIFLEAGRR